MSEDEDSDEWEDIDQSGGDPFEVLKELFKEDNIAFNTELSYKEIVSISRIMFLAEYLELPEFNRFVTTIMKLKVSHKRKGRGEFLKGFAGIKEAEDMKAQMMDQMGQSFGR